MNCVHVMSYDKIKARALESGYQHIVNKVQKFKSFHLYVCETTKSLPVKISSLVFSRLGGTFIIVTGFQHTHKSTTVFNNKHIRKVVKKSFYL